MNGKTIGSLLTLGLVLGLITGIILCFAGSETLLTLEMRRFAPPEWTGLPETEYPAMGKHIADYLTGRKDSFQYSMIRADGESVSCFHDYEIIHMEDCRRLIRLVGIVCAGCLLTAGAAVILLLNREHKERVQAWTGGKRMLGILGGIAGGLALWGLVNFDGLFVTFHLAAFQNDYWLLNPRTDLLIRLMPETMFMDLGIKGLALFSAGLAVFMMICRLALRTGKSREGMQGKE